MSDIEKDLDPVGFWRNSKLLLAGLLLMLLFIPFSVLGVIARVIHSSFMSGWERMNSAEQQ